VATQKFQWTWIERKVILDAINFHSEQNFDDRGVAEHPFMVVPPDLVNDLGQDLVDDYSYSGDTKTYKLTREEFTALMRVIHYTLDQAGPNPFLPLLASAPPDLNYSDHALLIGLNNGMKWRD